MPDPKKIIIEAENKSPFLEEFFRRNQEVADTFERNKDIEFEKTPREGMRAYEELSDALFLRKKLNDVMAKRFRKLTREQQTYFFDHLFPEKLKKETTLERFLANIADETYISGQLHFSLQVSQMGSENVARELDKLLSEADKEEMAKEIKDIVTPNDPTFPRDRLTVCPEKPLLDELKKDISPNDPAAAEKEALLERARSALSVTTNEAAIFYDNKRVSIEGTKLQGLENEFDHVVGDIVKDYIDNRFEDPGLKDILPKTKRGIYDELDISTHIPYTKEQVEKMRATKSGISSGLKQSVLNITQEMAGIGDNVYRQSGGMLIDNIQLDGSTTQQFRAEQGIKNYAFNVLVKAQLDLQEAVKSRNLDSIREKTEEYERIRRHTDRMMEIAREAGDYPLAGGNMSPTRVDGSSKNRFPPEYLREYANMSKVNSVLQLDMLCKNNGLKPEDVLEDPVSAMIDVTTRHFREFGPNAPKTTIGKLVHGMSSNGWNTMLGRVIGDLATLGRVGGGIAGMAQTEEERNQILAAFGIASFAGKEAITKDLECWQELTMLPKDKKEALYTAAFLSPEKDFDIIQTAEELKDPNWKQKFDPASMAKKLRDEGKLDLNVLSERIEEAMSLEKGLPEKLCSNNSTDFNAVDYMRAASRSCAEALLHATEQERGSEIYQKLQRQQKQCMKLLKLNKLNTLENAETARFNKANEAFKKKLQKDPVAKSLSKQIEEEIGKKASAATWIEGYKQKIKLSADELAAQADYPATYVARIMAARELSNSKRGDASTLNEKISAQDIEDRAAKLMASANFSSFAKKINQDAKLKEKVNAIFTKKHSHGGELDDLFREHLRKLPAGELRSDASLKRWMPTVKQRIEALQEQAGKALKTGGETYKEAAEIMMLRISAGVKRGGKGLDAPIPLKSGAKNLSNVVLVNAEDPEIREAYKKSNGPKYICKGHGGEMLERYTGKDKAPVEPDAAEIGENVTKNDPNQNQKTKSVMVRNP